MADFITIIWDLDDDPDGNVQHIAANGFTKEDVVEVLSNPTGSDTSRSSGEPIDFGYTPDGRYIGVVYEQVDEFSVRPITAFDVPEPRS